MVSEAKLAVSLDPINPNGYSVLAFALMLDGQHQESLHAVDRAMQLDPQHPAFYLYQKGAAYFMLKDYAKAIEYLDRALTINPANFPARNVLIATYGHLGDYTAVKEQIELHPLPVSIDWLIYYWRFRKTADSDHFIQGLRLAGIPDVATELPQPPQD